MIHLSWNHLAFAVLALTTWLYSRKLAVEEHHGYRKHDSGHTHQQHADRHDQWKL